MKEIPETCIISRLPNATSMSSTLSGGLTKPKAQMTTCGKLIWKRSSQTRDGQLCHLGYRSGIISTRPYAFIFGKKNLKHLIIV
jgi:hypothetical protein